MEEQRDGIFWQKPVQEQELLGYIAPEDLRILVVPKPFDLDVDKALQFVVEFLEKKKLTFYLQSLLSESDKENMFISPESITECECIKSNICSICNTSKINVPEINRVITLGGDGTILHAVKMFYNKDVPPIISFSLGSLGYLCQFEAEELSSVLENCLLNINTPVNTITELSNNLYKIPKLDNRSRLKVSIEPNSHDESIKVNSTVFKDNFKEINSQSCIFALNEISIDSGKFTKFISFDIYINDVYLTRLEAFGIICSTPTGSTAYNMSSGGCIVCTSVSSISLTPMNPRSLSVRPLVLPINCEIKIKIPKNSGKCKASIDGDFSFNLQPNQCLKISGGDSSVPLVTYGSDDPLKEWIDNVKSKYPIIHKFSCHI